MEKIIILGKGGHASSVVDVIEREGRYQIAGYVVNDDEIIQESEDYPVLGKDSNLKTIFKSGIRYAALGIGYLGKGTVRMELYKMLKKIGFQLPIVCDPSAVLAEKIKIEEGTFIGKNVIINAGSVVEKMCIINSGAIIEHDCYVEEFTHVAVGAVLCGAVHIGREVLLGANSTVIQGRNVGNMSLIGAGEVLKKDIASNMIYCNGKYIRRF